MWYNDFHGRDKMDAEVKIETKVRVKSIDKIGRVKNFVPQKTLFLVDFEDGTSQLILHRDQFEVINVHSLSDGQIEPRITQSHENSQ